MSSLSVLSLRLVGDIVINETPHKVLCSSTYHSPTQLVSQNKETATQSKCKSYFGFKYIHCIYMRLCNYKEQAPRSDDLDVKLLLFLFFNT